MTTLSSSKMIQVTRRSGAVVPLDISRIRTVVEWACRGLDTPPLTLEAGMTARLQDGVTTREIQDNLIDCALSLCSPTEPDWRYVAGRLCIWSLWKDTQVQRATTDPIEEIYKNYAQTAIDRVNAARYDWTLMEYSYGDLEIAASWIDPAWDADYDYAGAVLLTSRYLLPNELPQEAFLTCALLLASVESPLDRLKWAHRFYLAIAQRKISLATPILANLRVPNGSLSSCFITTMRDDIESIFETITDTARISKNGGGVGVNVSQIRATGSWVMGRPNASGGVLPWAKLLNDTAIAVNQGGRRSGAVTVSLDIWHLDVPEFLECQTENGDQRRKAYDIFPQLVIPDLFMQRVANKESWTLFDPYEVRMNCGIELAQLWGENFETAYAEIEAAVGQQVTLYKQVDARELFKQIMRSQLETGMPYLAFKDAINRANPNKHMGYIPGVNLCTESFSNVNAGVTAHCCNLDSLNLANIEDSELPSLCESAVRILDNAIELTHPPFEAAQTHNDLYRTIGVGVMGLADWLAKRRLSYQSLPEIRRLFEDIAYHCTRSSMILSKLRGCFEAFDGSEWNQGRMMAKPIEWFQENATQPERWVQLQQDVREHGIRNSHIMAIAPNTSSSLVQGCTASVLPTYSRFFYDKWAKGVVPVAPPFIRDRFWFYQENKTISQEVVIRAIAEMQQWIDTGISMELLFNLNPGIYYPDNPDRSLEAKDIFDLLILAWREGCKAIYYIRTVQKDGFKESETCGTCSN
jgi:ribonucleoside-diphosphate reductase alpha chain